MKQEIKERVEQIQNGIVPDGYKKTKVGIIPEDWEEKRLDEILEFKNGINSNKDSYGKGKKFINVLDVLNNNYITYNSILGRIDISEKEFNANKVEYGDILFQRSSETVEEAGSSNVYLDNKPVTFGGFIIRGQKIGEYNPVFMNYHLKNSSIRKQIMMRAYGSTRFNIGQNSLNEIIYSSPEILEQKRIASILETWDRAIELKEKLIQEKQTQKKGLMDKLFLRKVKDSRMVRVGTLINESKIVEDTPTVDKLLSVKLHLGGVFKRTLRGNETVGATTLYKRKSGQFIYGKQNFHNGALGLIPKSLDGYLSSSDIPSFDFNEDKVSPKYFYYYWSREYKYKRLENFTTGTGSKRLNPKDIYKIRMELPSLSEQQHIAKILSTADQELELLKEEVELLKEQKKGLMQLLLTGIIRV